MSIKNIQSNGLSPRNTEALAIEPQNNTWVRNPSWVAFPSITSSDNKFIGIFAVYNTTDNFVALLAEGNYNVDWGDGTSNLGVTTNTQVNKNFSYASAALAGTDAPVTFTDSTDLVTRTSHGYTDGMTVSFYNIVSTTGLTEGQEYYVISATTNTFQVSNTLGGSAIALTTDGTATLLPYKQAIVTVTPASGQTFSRIDIARLHNQAGLLSTCSVNWLDVVMAGSSLANMVMTNAALVFTVCERIRILKASRTSYSNFLNQAYPSLCSFELSGTSGITALSSILVNCYKLTNVYFENTSSVTTMAGLFSGCISLTSVSLPDTSSVTDMSSMFNGCYSLKIAPLLNTSNVLNMATMFQNCTKLISVPLYNTIKVTDMTSMFNGCLALKTVPLFNTNSVTTMATMFQNCSALTSVPLFNTSNLLNASFLFAGCSALISVPLLNTIKVTNMNSMFSGCKALKNVPLFNTVAVTSMSSMFYQCYSLTSIPLLNTGLVTTTFSMFYQCWALTSIPLLNTANVLTMDSMFYQCYSLTSIPLINTIKVTNMSSMFYVCRTLKTVPLLNTALVTNCANMFYYCISLVTIPAFNFTSVTTTATTTMFFNCINISAIKMINMRNTFSVINLKLSGAALNEIYTNLPTVTGKTITVTGNYGTATDTPLIATAKGWAVTG